MSRRVEENFSTLAHSLAIKITKTLNDNRELLLVDEVTFTKNTHPTSAWSLPK